MFARCIETLSAIDRRVSRTGLLTAVALGMLLLVPMTANAIPASPHAVEVVQPDGTKIALHIRGDEFFNWYEDVNRFTVLRDADRYVYAKLDKDGRLAPTALVVGRDDPRAAGLAPRTLPDVDKRGGRPEVQQQVSHDKVAGSRSTAPSGTVKNLVVPIRFANHTARPLPSAANLNTVFNAVGGDPTLAPTGSIRDVYLENSYGKMSLESTVVDWVDVSESEAYYANGVSGDWTVWEALREALDALDSQIDFRQFDNNNDGYIDAIAFLHSGYDAAAGGVDIDGADYHDRIWSNRWVLYPEWESKEGVRVYDYHISAGLWGLSGSEPVHIGVVAHETGHFFGLPDFYDTDGSSEGIGSYGMMANSWGFDGSQLYPPHFCAYSKIFLGWLTPTTVTTMGIFSVPQVETNPVVYRVDQNYPSGEYLLIENRQPTGIEAVMPQGGLAIWHIDEAKEDNNDEGFPGQAGWPGNNQHYRVALLQADGAYEFERNWHRGEGDELFHHRGVSAINDDTVPDIRSYKYGNIADSTYAISNISTSGEVMTFTIDQDCDENGTLDAIDIAGGAVDCNNDGVPDECQLAVELTFDQAAGGESVVAQSFSDAGAGEYNTKAWDDFVLTQHAAINGGTAAFTDWDGFGHVDFLVEIANRAGGAEAGGTVVLSTLANGLFGSVYWDFEGATLPAGTWWLSVSATGGYDTYDQVFWFRANEGSPVGEEHRMHNPGGGFGVGRSVLRGSDWLDSGPADLAFSLSVELLRDCNLDGTLDDCEPDCDGDGLPDECALADGLSEDLNSNGVPDECDPDADGDGIPDDLDPCPQHAFETPGVCGCGVADVDTDGDGTLDCGDGCPKNAGKTSPGICGCGTSDVDSDGDGIPDCNDRCPGEHDVDTDKDGVLNCDELCPYDPLKTQPGKCGCGEDETDTDSDGTPDCSDLCPTDPDKVLPGQCNCGTPDTDRDGDGMADCVDGTPDGNVQELRITGPETLFVGDTGQYSAAVVFTSGDTLDVSDQVTWATFDTVLHGGGPPRGDFITPEGMLAVDPGREIETILSVIGTFRDGLVDVRGSLLVEVLMPETVDSGQPISGPVEVPVDQPLPDGSSSQGGTSSGGSAGNGTACGVGSTGAAMVSLLLLGFVRVSRTRRPRR